MSNLNSKMNLATFARSGAVLLALAGKTAFAAPAAVQPAAPKSLPNVVLIFTDDQGYADLGSFGAKGFTTPNIDTLARQGRRFTDFHVAQPICSASRSALLTGCYPSRIGIQGALGPHSRIGISDGEETLAQLFKSKGYSTGMVGKWHLGDAKQFLPTHHGFDEYLGLPYSHDMWPHHPESPQSYLPLPLIKGDQVIKAGMEPSDMEGLTTMYTERAVSFIDKNKNRPFFLYLAHNLPHVPLFVSSKFKGKTQRGLYGDVMEEIDWSVGEVMKALERNHLDQNTLVIFTSDNGPWLSYGDHAGSAFPLREGKGTSWEGGTRVPCVMRWPGHIKAGSQCDDMLMTIDLLPTLAHQIGAQLPSHSIDGLDVWPLLAGEKGAKNPHPAYYCYYENNQLQAVTSGDGHWKLQLPHTYRTLGGRPGGTGGKPVPYQQRTLTQPELYDLRADESEAHNLAATHTDIVAQLQAEAEKARAELGDSLTDRIGAGVRPPGRIGSNVHAPQIKGKPLTITCEVSPPANTNATDPLPDGVILAQGGTANGYALYIKNGKLIFAVRQQNRLTATPAVAIPVGHLRLQAHLAVDGTLTLSVNGEQIATAKAPGLINTQPSDPLDIAQDTVTAVGEYRVPFAFQGKVEKVNIETDAADGD